MKFYHHVFWKSISPAILKFYHSSQLLIACSCCKRFVGISPAVSMSFAPSFGSVGDFIAITLLIKDVINALDDATGSRSEYQQLIRELLSLEKAFLEVGLLCQTPDQLPGEPVFSCACVIRAVYSLSLELCTLGALVHW